ncbi:MAG: argH1 [Phycisphaerales bacterium]|nr:argH1 [Phycisphaerales bacterium]
MAELKSWQARIGEATDALAQSFVESISYDRRLYKHDIAGSIAHATMLAKVGLITDAEREAIVGGLHSIQRDIEAGNFVFDESLEDIHMVVEDALIKRIGDPGRKLHTARSRNDQVALDLSLWVHDNAIEIGKKLRDLCRAYVALAQRSGDIVMPSYTHLQRAQPILAGAECLAWCTMFSRDADRCATAFQFTGTHDIPLGSGAIAGSSLPIDSGITAQLLGYEQPPLSSIEQTASRDQALEFLFSLAMAAMHLSRWAEQWVIYSSTEFSFIKTADRYTTGSSMMPQKRNPDMLELIRGRCGTVYGDLVSLLTICKGLPIGYNRDLQEDKRVLFRAYDTVSACVTMAAAIVTSTNYVRENIEPTLERGFLDATSLAEYLVTKGIAFRTAHKIVGTLVARCEAEKKPALAGLSVTDFVEAAKAAGANPSGIGADVYEALGSRNVARRYRSPGAAGGPPYEQRLAEWKAKLGV